MSNEMIMGSGNYLLAYLLTKIEKEMGKLTEREQEVIKYSLGLYKQELIHD